MAEARPPRGGLRRLAGEVRDERVALAALGERCGAHAAHLRGALGQGEPLESALAAAVALGLHRWYTALEATLERIERAHGTAPTGGDWHVDLLVGAARAIEATRPAILPAQAIEPLRELLKFRHFLRHAYAVELKSARLLELAEALEAVGAVVLEALDAFVAYLRAVAAEA